MTLANDANLPVRFKGRAYTALTMEDVAALAERIPERLMPRQLLPFVGVIDAMKFARSPFGLPVLMEVAAERSGQDTDDLTTAEQLELAGLLTDRLYGFDPVEAEAEQDDADTPQEETPPLADAPAS